VVSTRSDLELHHFTTRTMLFSNRCPYGLQGVVTGLFLAPNSSEPQQGGPKPEQQLDELLTLTDWIRYSLAGNLK